MKSSVRNLLLSLAVLNVLVLVASQDSYNCNGSTLCSGLNSGDCDAARRKIDPNRLYFTGGTAAQTGECSGHCGLFVSGSNCDLSGNEMLIAFSELRARNCAKCGIKTYNDGCQFKADYVSRC